MLIATVIRFFGVQLRVEFLLNDFWRTRYEFFKIGLYFWKIYQVL